VVRRKCLCSPEKKIKKMKQIPGRKANTYALRVVGWCKGRLVPAEGVGASLSVVAD
jgi:hypothetical protein